ncbi:MAG: recombinase family protein [Clostridia bacterium]|nr:recombinase family protein [Clostridia bacterium]
MKKSNRKQFVIYSRKSKFTGKGESIENQIELCRQYIATQYSRQEADAALVYEDEGFSGGTLERPQFKQMMQDSKKQRIDAIIVYRLDRISRNIGDFAKLIEDLNEREIDFISIREQFDTSTPMGRAMMYIASVFSQLERETIAERIRDNMSELAKTGRWLGGTTPTGYESESISKVTVDGKVRKACKLKIIPEEISLVKTIFEKFVEFGSLTKVDQYLLESRVPTKRGKSFTRFAIKGILTNPVYLIADDAAYEYLTENEVDLFSEQEAFDGVHGIMAYNRTLQRQGKAQQPKPMNEWIVSVGAHEGVIPGKTWVHVQNMLSLNKSKSYRKPRSNVALVSGLLRCKACGDYMRPKLSNRVNAKGEYIYSYLCATKERSRSCLCQMKNVSGNLLDAMVIAEIKKLGEGWDGSDYAKHLAEAKKAIASQQDEYDAEIASVREKIAANEKEIKNLVATLAKISGSVSESYVVEQIGELHKDGEALRNRLSELEALNAQNELTDLEFNLIRQTLASFSCTVDEMSVQQKRNAIRSLVKRIVWDGADVHLYLLGSTGDDEIPDLTTGAFDGIFEPLCEDSE